MDRENSNRPKRRTAIVARELLCYDIDIAALSETRLPGEDQLVESGAGYTFFWKGSSAEEKRLGVGFAVKAGLIDFIEHPTGVNNRITHLRLSLTDSRFITIFSIYAPTMTNSEETIMHFYQELKTALTKVPVGDKLLLLGDFNARVGNGSETWMHLENLA